MIIYTPDSKYILTANEGDAREFGDFNALEKIKISGKRVEVLDKSKFDGLEEGKNFILGGRSFSIRNADTMEPIFDK